MLNQYDTGIIGQNTFVNIIQKGGDFTVNILATKEAMTL